MQQLCGIWLLWEGGISLDYSHFTLDLQFVTMHHVLSLEKFPDAWMYAELCMMCSDFDVSVNDIHYCNILPYRH